MLIALMSAKGSPGVTTTALALAAASTVSEERTEVDPALLVEADLAGGDLECWCGPHGEPGLLGAVTDVRDLASAHRLRSHAVEVVAGVRAVVAPTTDAPMAAALDSASDGFFAALRELNGTVLADCGRCLAGSVVAGRLVARASLVVVVCRPTLVSVEHSRALVAALSPRHNVIAIVVGGTRPYGPDEIALALGTPVAGVLPWDARGVATLVQRGAIRAWHRTALGVAAGELLESVGHHGGVQRTGRAHG